MASNRNIMIVAGTVGFQSRIKYALSQACLDVMAEPGVTTGHASRVAFAQKALSGTAPLYEYSVAVLNNPTIAQAVDITKTLNDDFGVNDSDLPFVVNSVFNAFAGVAN